MDLSKIKNIVRNENKILIDYTTKIKDNIDFIKIQVEKINKERYNNIIFLFKVHHYYQLTFF